MKQIMEKSYWKTNTSIELPDTEPSVSLKNSELCTAEIEEQEHADRECLKLSDLFSHKFSQ